MFLVTKLGKLPKGKAELKRALDSNGGIQEILDLQSSCSIDRFTICNLYGVNYYTYQVNKEEDASSWMLFGSWFHTALRHLRKELADSDDPMLLVMPSDLNRDKQGTEDGDLCYLIKAQGQDAATWLALRVNADIKSAANRVSKNVFVFFEANPNLLDGMDMRQQGQLKGMLMSITHMLDSLAVGLSTYVERDLLEVPTMKTLLGNDND